MDAPNEFDPEVLRVAESMEFQGLPDGHPDLRPADEEEQLDPSDGPLYNIGHMGQHDAELFAEAMRMQELAASGAFKGPWPDLDEDDETEGDITGNPEDDGA